MRFSSTLNHSEVARRDALIGAPATPQDGAKILQQMRRRHGGDGFTNVRPASEAALMMKI
jgi:hypothetical protein